MPSSARFDCGAVALHVRTWPCEQPAHPAVVLLPGTGLTASDWDVVAAALSQRRVVHAVDLRGHGSSDRPGRYSIALMADDVTQLLPQLGSQADLVGHSLGGLVACRVTARSSLVRRLVLEDVGLMRTRTPTKPERPNGTLLFDWAVVEQVRPEIDTPSADWPGVLRALRVPVLAISGGPASFVPQEWVGDLVDVVDDGAMVTIDAGHEVHASRPGEFVDALRAFLL